MPNNRVEKLLEKLDKSGLDGFLISSPPNRRYFSGFSGSSGLLLISRSTQLLATDFRYWEQAASQAPDFTIFKATKGLKEWFADFVSRAGVSRVGFESSDVTVSTASTMRRSLKKAGIKTSLISSGDLCSRLRITKDAQEIALIKKAAAISDGAAEHARRVVRAGMSEIELAWEIEGYMRTHGSEPIGFSVICASGPNSALPHATPSNKPINPGEPIVCDFGACVDGYTSDLTRTICVGEPDSQFKKLYNIVFLAQKAAIEGIFNGIKASEADALARSVIQEAGYGDYFGHSLGHGIGLEVHEAPFLGPSSKDTLGEGMVFTIEPGIYLPGWGGVRIEDDALLENNRVTLLSKAAK
ncbi:MAG: aminopeptidase P family protein [Dehalococcoidales bacterium]|jgi:Xaa-Pro aminopeptidase|nr:aminopeptidase P family protein [Dehalococcoidales bacterium]MDX9803615.1 aminopeptidase P family protein [Dehalococcoidales bacterium]